MTSRRPAEVFPPGEFLREELEARGWTQADFAEILGRPARLVNEIIAGKRTVTPETAKGLAAALGTSPEFWLKLEADYQLWRARGDDEGPVARRARLYSLAPVKDMVRRGWLEPSRSIEVLEQRVLQFFEMKSLDDEPAFLPHAARKSSSYDDLTPAQRVWLFRARKLARGAPCVGRYSRAAFEKALEQLRRLLHTPQEIRHVPRILSEAGIRFVIVQPLPGTKIDGACFWLEDGAPVIALSLRYDRIDYFWFTLFHELRHVRDEDPEFDTDLEGGRVDEGLPESEQLANVFASEQLLPPQQLDDFIARVGHLYSARKIEAFAHTAQVHPGIVVGQLHHRGEVSYANLRAFLVPIREWMSESALMDGWDSALPARL